MKIEAIAEQSEAPFCTVTLTRTEADLLMTLCGNIGGNHGDNPLKTNISGPLAQSMRTKLTSPLWAYLRELLNCD